MSAMLEMSANYKSVASFLYIISYIEAIINFYIADFAGFTGFAGFADFANYKVVYYRYASFFRIVKVIVICGIKYHSPQPMDVVTFTYKY